MPDLFFKVGVVNGKATLEQMKTLDGAYKKVGTTGVKAFKEGEKAASVFGGTLKNVKSIAAGLGLTFGGLAIVSAIRGWIGAAVEFDKEFANVTTLLDTAKVNTAAMREELRGLGAELGTSAELTKGLYQALSAGVEAGKAVQFVGKSAEFARAALTDTFTAVDIMTTILNAYQMSADRAGEVTDDLFEIIKQGKTTGAELAASLGPAIPTAAALEVGLKEVGAAVATLTKGGFNTATAVVSLNAAMLNFLSPTTQAVDVAKKYNLELTASAVQSKGLAVALGEMAEKVKGDAEAVAALFPNIRALRAALALTGKQSEEYTRILEKMQHTAGNTATAFEKQMQTIDAQWTKTMNELQKQVDGVVMKLKGALIPTIKTLGEAIKNVDIGSLTVGTLAFFAALKGQAILTSFISGLSAIGAGAAAATGGLAALAAGIAGYAIWSTHKKQIKEWNDELYRMGIVTPEALEKIKEAEEDLNKLGLEVARGEGEKLTDYAIRLSDLQDKVVNGLGIPDELLAEYNNMYVIMGKNGEVLSTLSELTEEEYETLQELMKGINEAIKPAEELAKSLDILDRAGINSSKTVKALSSEIIAAVEQSELMGVAIPPVVAKLYEQAKAFEEVKKKAKDLKTEEERLKTILSTELPIAIANLTNKELAANAQGLAEHVAQLAKAQGKVDNLSDGYKFAMAWLTKYDAIITKNKGNLREQNGEFQKSIDYTGKLATMYARLGVSSGQNIKEMEEAFRFLQKDGMQSVRTMSDGLTNLMSEYIKQNRTVPEDIRKTLEEMAFDTDVNVRERMLPVWMNYYASLRDENGQWPEEYAAKLKEIMDGNNTVLKHEMLPAWEKYIETLKKLYTNLPVDIKEMDEKIKDFTKDTAKETTKVWENQVSTIVTDWSQGITDIVFRAKSGTQMILDTLEEFGRMAFRILLESFFDPFKEALGNLMKSLTGALQKRASGSLAGMIPGLGGDSGIAGGAMFAGGALLAANGMRSNGWGGVLQGGAGGYMLGRSLGGSFGGVVGLETGLGASLLSQGIRQGGAAGWGKSIGGGALTGMGIGTMILPGIGTAIGAAVGATAGAMIKGIQAINGKNAWEAGYMEVGRDAGLQMSQEQFTAAMQQYGWSESQLYGHRAEAIRSPRFIAEQLIPLAQSQGQLEQLLQRLEPSMAKTGHLSWGQDFRSAVEEGMLTGDWETLNKVWYETSGLGKELAKTFPDIAEAMKMGGSTALETAQGFMEYYDAMKEAGRASEEFTTYIEENRDQLESYADSSEYFAGKLAEVDAVLESMKNNAAELAELDTIAYGFQTIKAGLENFQVAGNGMIELFINQGKVTDAFREKVKELGGEVEALEESASLIRTNNYFGQLVDHFRQTGEILPDLNQIMQDFGETVEGATDLKGMNQTIASLNEFRDSMNAFVAETTGLQDVMTGLWDQGVMDKLFSEGFDPKVFEGIAKLVGGMKSWESAVSTFQRSGTLVGTEGQMVRDMLTTYGGEEGKLAVERLDAGFNTITSALLEKTKEAMEAAYLAEKEGVMDYIDEAQTQLQSRADEITATIESQFTLVSDNIAAAFVTAREAAVEQIDLILEKIKEMNDAIVFGSPLAAVAEATPEQTTPASTNPADYPTNPTGPESIILNAVLENNGNIYSSTDLETMIYRVIKEATAGGSFNGILQQP